MSREVNPNAKNLSDDDKLYLAQRGQLPVEIMSTEDQRKLLDPSRTNPTGLELANTGTVATMTTEDLEAELERRRAEVVSEDDLKKLMTNPGGVDGAAADEDDDDRITENYDSYKKGQLSAEIAARNSDREENDEFDGYEPMALSGSKDELVARLTQDDEDYPSDEEE